MRRIVDLRYAAPSSVNLAPRVRGAPQPPIPPNVVVMRKVRGGWNVDGRRFDDADAAMAYTDRLATERRLRVWIET